MPTPTRTQEQMHPHVRRLIQYFLREHERGRPPHEVVEDAFVQGHDPRKVDEAREHVDRALMLRAL